ncbi:MAG: SusD/RagB family nutrient-binding outer membrane lipoprotein [Algibacter sp.]
MRIYKLFILLFGMAAIFQGCTDNFTELNTDKNNLTEDTVDRNTIGLIFAQSVPSALLHLPQGNEPWFPFQFQTAQALFPDLYVQYFATTFSGFQSDAYEIIGGWNGSTWSGFYSGCAPQLKFFTDFTSENDIPVENAIGKVWTAFAYNRMTTFYGPIPFSQFGNGENSVAYDTQESIYTEHFRMLDEAVAVLQGASSTALGSNDLIYNGDPAKWYKFANTLRLRLALQIKDANPALAQAEAEKAVAAGVITTVSDNAMMTTNNPSNKNAYNVISAWSEFRMSAAMESVLKGFDDPRMPEYYSPAANGDGDGDGVVYEGLRNGQTVEDRADTNLDLVGSNSNVGPRYLPEAVGENNPYPVMRAAEAYLSRAEGALLGWNMGGSTQDLYESGINASLEEWGTPDANYVASTNSPAAVGDSFNTPALSSIPVAFETGGTTERQLEQIMTQKWIALYPDSWTSWVDVRRTGYPTLYDRIEVSPSGEPGVGVGDIMSRLTYVSSEYDTNADAVNAALALPEMSGGDNGSTKLWIHQ